MNVSNKIFFSFFVFLMVSCKAQTLPINTPLFKIPQNAHLKDINNVLSPYTGIYKADNNNREITLYITKIADKLEERSNKSYYMDALVIKYTVKNSSGIILQDTQNTQSNIELYSYYLRPSENTVVFYYSGTNCGVGWGDIYLKKINPTQISWDYIPEHTSLTSETCPGNPDLTIYLPETKNLIFTKQ